MSSQTSIINFVTSLVHWTSPDLLISAEKVHDGLLLTVKVLHGPSSSTTSQFLSAILRLGAYPEITAEIRAVNQILQLRVKLSGEALTETQQSRILESVLAHSHHLQKERTYLRAPPLSPSTSKTPSDSPPGTPTEEEWCNRSEDPLTAAEPNFRTGHPVPPPRDDIQPTLSRSSTPARVPSPGWLDNWDRFAKILRSLQEKASTMAQARADGLNGNTNGENADGGFKLKFCTVCASNNNRSMESHLRLAAANFPVISFGTGSLVRLPGATITEPNVYQFNKTSYDSMYKELEAKDARLYRANGILNMLGRNRGVKWGPERWQDWQVGAPRLQHTTDQGSEGSEGGVVDVVITCEERCWDAVIEDLHNRGSPLNRPVHVINVDIKDNHEEALVGGKGILDLANSLNKAAAEERARNPTGFDGGTGASRSGFDERVPEIIGEWQERWPNLPAVWTLAWF